MDKPIFNGIEVALINAVLDDAICKLVIANQGETGSSHSSQEQPSTSINQRFQNVYKNKLLNQGVSGLVDIAMGKMILVKLRNDM